LGRQLRIEYPGAHYHVTARGNERKDIFKSNRDREKFLSYLESAVIRYGAVIHAWCLMSNHYHLLIETPSGNLSQVMQHINGAYTNYFNVKRKRSGHLFQGRYKAILIEADAYALELSRYIHLNPIRVGVISEPSKYPWSSCRHYTGVQAPPAWLKTSFILGFFGAHETAAQEKYLRFVDELAGSEYKSPLSDTVASTILGTAEFIERIQEQHIDVSVADRNLPALRMLAVGRGIEEIFTAVQGALKDRKSLAKKIAIYLCHRYSGMKLREIGEGFGIKESGVTQTSKRFVVEMEREKELQAVVSKLKQELDL